MELQMEVELQATTEDGTRGVDQEAKAAKTVAESSGRTSATTTARREEQKSFAQDVQGRQREALETQPDSGTISPTAPASSAKRRQLDVRAQHQVPVDAGDHRAPPQLALSDILLALWYRRKRTAG